MIRCTTILLVQMTLALGGCAVFVDGGTATKELRCEYRANPLGIDVVKPRLSWILQSSQRGQKQSAYQILVASSKERLKKNDGDLWDTGKVGSDQSIQVVYAGRPLKSRTQCYWKVRVWDREGKALAWSQPACWTMGMLNPKDWQAEWIGYDAEPPASYDGEERTDPLSLEGCKWVWFGEGDPSKSAPVGTQFFRRKFDIPSDRNIKQAQFRLVVDNEGVLFVNGQQVQEFSGWKPPYTFDVTEKLKAGVNTLAIAATNQGDAPNPAGLGGKLLVEFEAGDAISILIDRSWKVSGAKQDDWQQSDFDDAAWANANEIAKLGDQPWGEVHKARLILPPPPYLRKAFSIDKSIKRAVVYASALGLYELHINGKRVGQDCFTPGWTDYPTRVYYQTYDVTDLVKKGSNAIGAILADGW